DGRTVDPHDLVASDLIYPNRKGEIYTVRYNPAHRWYYVPKMTADEALLLKCYDSLTDGRTRFGPHTAFVDPTTPADAAPRESIEVRTLVFHKQSQCVMALPGAPGSVPGTYRNKSTFAAPGRATGSGAVRTQTTLFFSLATFSLSAFSVAQAES